MKNIILGMRLLSCMLWGIGGVIALPTSFVLGALSIFSATLFLCAIILEWGNS